MKLLGHRGARHEAPENTLRAIGLALDSKMDGVEIDIHQSSDGQLMVIHDFTVNRTTNGEGKVSELSSLQLKKLDAGEGESIPTLKEVISLTYQKAKLFIEVKGLGCETPLIELLKKYDPSWFIIKSFDHRILKFIHDKNPELFLAPLMVGVPADPLSLVNSCGGKAISLPLDYLDREIVLECHRHQVKVCGWNCNQPRELKYWKEIGLDWLGTDIPQGMAQSPDIQIVR